MTTFKDTGTKSSINQQLKLFMFISDVRMPQTAHYEFIRDVIVINNALAFAHQCIRIQLNQIKEDCKCLSTLIFISKRRVYKSKRGVTIYTVVQVGICYPERSGNSTFKAPVMEQSSVCLPLNVLLSCSVSLSLFLCAMNLIVSSRSNVYQALVKNMLCTSTQTQM